jgi:NAD(P)-dependent dehydrogenase (short-subunit alcohol dehydrogenase family)
MDVLIVGASGSIGEELARIYWAKHSSTADFRLFVTHRKQGFKGLEGAINMFLDYEDEKSVVKCVSLLTEKELRPDIVVFCSGFLHNSLHRPEKRISEVSENYLFKSFQINAAGPLLFFSKISEMIKNIDSAKVVFLSAQVGSIEDNRSGGWYGYRMSKAALNMAIKSISIEAARWVKPPIVVAIHPGTTISNLSKRFLGQRTTKAQTPAECATKLSTLISSLDFADNGKFLTLSHDVLPW